MVLCLALVYVTIVHTVLRVWGLFQDLVCVF